MVDNFKIMVKDTGVGISKENLKMMFTRFTKVMDHRHMNSEGVGLGLIISKNLALALGGDLYVVSEVDKGSIFTFEIQVKSKDI